MGGNFHPPQEASLDCSNHLGISLSNHTRRAVSSFSLLWRGGSYGSKLPVRRAASPREEESSRKSSLSAGLAVSEPEGFLSCTPTSSFWPELWKGCGLLLWKGCAVLSVACDLGDFHELNLSAALRAPGCQLHLCK